jgi:hypothetical protein
MWLLGNRKEIVMEGRQVNENNTHLKTGKVMKGGKNKTETKVRCWGLVPRFCLE